MKTDGKIINADKFLEAVLCNGADMVCPITNPCVDCNPIDCYGCPFRDFNFIGKEKES